MRVFLIFAILWLLVCFTKDLKAVLENTGMGLRSKITGARLWRDGYDPYFTKWQPGMSDIYLDSWDYSEHVVNRNTCPPPLLILFTPIASLNYYYIKLLWLGLTWGALIFILIFFYKKTENVVCKNLIVIIPAIFIIGSDQWHLHEERGQIYIFYTLALTVSYFLFISGNRNKIMISGWILGFMILIRPPFLCFVLPVIIMREWKLLTGIGAGLVSCIIFSFAFHQTDEWISYFKAMEEYGKFLTNEMSAPNKTLIYPQTGEGVNLFKWVDKPGMELFAIQGLAFQYLHIKLYNYWLLVILGILGLLMLGFIYFNLKNKKVPSETLFLTAFLLMMLNEYFIPAMRVPYNYIQWLFPLLLIIRINRIPRPLVMALCVTGLLLNVGFEWLTNNQIIGECLLFLGVLIFIKQYSQDENLTAAN